MLQIKVGKAPINDIVINDTFVSREHLEIFIDSDKNVFITDLDSANGTYVNGIRIKNSVKLETFDILLIGNTLIEWPQFLIDGYNVDKVYETLKDPPLLAKDPQEIENNKLNLFNNLKIQFHNFMEFAEERKNNIRTHLQKEFNLVYDFFFVWEGWAIKK